MRTCSGDYGGLAMPEIACIEPMVGDRIASLEWLSLVDNLGRLSVAPTGRLELRVHWFSCPHCRKNFPYTQEILAVITHAIEDRVSGSLNLWAERWNSEAESGQAENANDPNPFANKLAGLAQCGIEVQGALSFVVEELTDFTTELDSSEFPAQRMPLSICADFILGLRPEVQRFVFEAVRCQEFLMPPMQGVLGPPKISFPRSDEEISSIEADLQKVAGEKGSVREMLRDIFERQFDGATEGLFQSVEVEANNRLERFSQNTPPSLAKAAELNARPRGIATPTSSELERVRREMSDGFDSLKAGQMELIRLSERSGRSAVAFEPEIEAKLGTLYGLLNEKTRLLLQGAEYLYHINRSEPDFSHGAVINLALAYENEMLICLIWPYLEKLRADGVADYSGGGIVPKSLLLGGKEQDKNLNLGNFGWYLNNDLQIRAWVRNSKGLNPNDISHDAAPVIRGRDTAAHKAVCNQSIVENLRTTLFKENGILAHLHRT